MAILIPIIIFFGLAGWLVWYMLSHDRGQKEPVGALWITFALGFVGIFPAIILEMMFVPDKIFGSNTAGVPLIFLGAMTVGLVEECCKFIPAALFLYKKRYFNEHIDGVLYFAIAGLGFGLPENIMYTIQFGLRAGIGRLILTPFFHAATTAFVGFFLIKAKLDHKPIWSVGLALLAAIILHGLYDFGLLSGLVIFALLSLVITAGMSVALFVMYRRATRDDQLIGMSAVGNNAFCRACGFANPNHNLYCARCGQHA